MRHATRMHLVPADRRREIPWWVTAAGVAGVIVGFWAGVFFAGYVIGRAS